MGNPVGVIRMILRGRFMSSIEVRGHENNIARMENSEARLLVGHITKGGSCVNTRAGHSGEIEVTYA